MFKKLKWLSIPIAAVLIAALLVMMLPVGVSVTSSEGILSIGVGTVQAQEDIGKPAYQVCIPNGVGNETGLQVFPPELQLGGGSKDNWLAVQSPDGLDVPVGTYTYGTEGDAISVDKYSGAIHVDSLTNNLIITAGALSEKCKYDIDVASYILYGGEPSLTETGKTIVSELRARFRSYVYGSGSDLYRLEDTPQNQEIIKREIIAIRVYAIVIAQSGETKATASTRILVNAKKYNGTDVTLTPVDQRIVTTYTINPQTKLPWTWQDVDGLEAGVTLKSGECSYIYVEVELIVHSQTFFPITPVEVTPGTAAAWTDVDVSAYVPSGATGVILHFVNTHTTTYYNVGVRKNGSTDGRYLYQDFLTHSWVTIGIDANRIFETYIGSTTYIDIYLVGYTMSGVTFFTNAYDKSLSTYDAWLDINCATQAPSAIGVIFEVYGGATTSNLGFRKNGSTDNRINLHIYHLTFVIIGCDGSQICEGYAGDRYTDFFLIGYITDGCTFNLNATDVSLGGTGTWTDLTALPATANMGFIEVIASSKYSYGLRKNGSAEELYYYAYYHPWAFVECDASQIIEGKIANVAVDFFVVGYATAPVPDISVSPTSKDFGIVATSSTPYTTTTYFTIDNNSTMQTDQTISVTTATWSGGVGWTHSDTCEPGVNTAGLKAARGGNWGDADIIIKYDTPNYIYENCPATTDYSFGLKLIAPTSFTDGVQKQIIVRITAVAG